MKTPRDLSASSRRMVSHWKQTLGGITALLILAPVAGKAQIVITEFGQTLTENFDSMGTSDKTSLPAFWKAERLQGGAPYPVRQLGNYATAGTMTTRREGDLTGNTAGIINFGAGDAATALDRALGFHSNSNPDSGAQSGNIYAQFQNNTGQSLSMVSLAYDVEKYRTGTNPAGYRFQLSYSFDGVNWTDAGDDFRTYFGPDAGNDGYVTAPGVVMPVSGTVTFNTPVADGGLFYLAWNYSVASGGDRPDSIQNEVRNAQALAIDNFSLKAIPEPSSLAALTLAAFALVTGGRRWWKHRTNRA
ncbi:MAG TPA: hypothetical protein VNQ90_14450 [Chthoniobacteraceae bacterium]|nr:hypothetical protein [Chthoniobacteraceae bacterium]